MNNNLQIMDFILSPLRYLGIGASNVSLFLINFLRYMCLGSYYIMYYGIIKPIKSVFSFISDTLFLLFTPKQVKKEKELKISINYDEKGETIEASDPKTVDEKLKENQAKAKKKKSKISPQAQQRLDIERQKLIESLNSAPDDATKNAATFRYKALSPDGKIETNTFMGVSKLDIYTFLTGEGYTVYSIETSKLIEALYGPSFATSYKFSTKDLIFFLTQLVTYIKAGITLTEAMRILSKQLNKNKNQQRVMQSIVYNLTMGESFSSALTKQGNTFPQLLINMVRAAEAAGNLDETLDDMVEYYTEINSTRKQMMSAISYPSFVGIFSIVIVIFMMYYIVPQFVGIYDSAGAELNSLTLFVISLSEFFQNYLFVIIIVLVMFIIIFYLAYKNVKVFRTEVQTIMMKLPVIGNIIIYNELTIFTKTFASLLKNDVFITDSIEILSKLTNNEIYKKIMIDTISNITRGEKISESFKDNWAIPDIAYFMIVTGENTGQLADMMKKVSIYYQEQHRAIIGSLKALIEPAMIIFLAVIVGGVIIAVILPMFQLYGSVDLS